MVNRFPTQGAVWTRSSARKVCARKETHSNLGTRSILRRTRGAVLFPSCPGQARGRVPYLRSMRRSGENRRVPPRSVCRCLRRGESQKATRLAIASFLAPPSNPWKGSEPRCIRAGRAQRNHCRTQGRHTDCGEKPWLRHTKDYEFLPTTAAPPLEPACAWR